VCQIDEQRSDLGVDELHELGQRAIQRTVTDHETMGLVETWIKSMRDAGRAKFLELTFEPGWALETLVEELGRSVEN
jgi:hypothetical protein